MTLRALEHNFAGKSKDAARAAGIEEPVYKETGYTNFMNY